MKLFNALETFMGDVEMLVKMCELLVFKDVMDD